MSINVNVGNIIPSNVVEVGNEISVNQLAAITAATDPSATNPFSTAGHTHIIANVTGLQAELDGKVGTAHTHVIADVTNLSNELASKAGISHTHTLGDVTGLPAALADKAPLVHTHVIADTTGLQTALDGKSATTHLHTGVYAPVAHTHVIADTTGLQTALDGKSETTHLHAGVYAPVTHTHALTDVIALDTALANKSDIGHGHSNYALLSGATFSGEISAPQIGNLLNTDLIIDAYNDTGAGTHYYHKFNPYGGLILAPNGGYLSAGGYTVDSDGFKTSWIEAGDMGRTFVLSKTGLTWDFTKSLNYVLGTGFTFTDKLTLPNPTSATAGINIGSINSQANLTNSVAGDIWIGTWNLAYKTNNGTLIYGAATNVSNVFGSPQIIDTTHNTNSALRITQKGTGHALLVEDVLSPDSNAFVITNNGNVGIGVNPYSGPYVGSSTLYAQTNSNTSAAEFRRWGSPHGYGSDNPVVQIHGANGGITDANIALAVFNGTLLIQTSAAGGLKIGAFASSTTGVLNKIDIPVTATGTYNKEIEIAINGITYRIPCRQV